MLRIVLSIALCACGIQNAGGGAGLTFFGLFGEVFVCENYVDPALELCWADDNSSALEASLDDNLPGAWACHPTPRHAGPCIYRCPAESGCNALSSCWCPP